MSQINISNEHWLINLIFKQIVLLLLDDKQRNKQIKVYIIIFLE